METNFDELNGLKGNVLSIGNGLAVYMVIPKDNVEGLTADITIKAGTLSNLVFQTQRDIAPSYISGYKNPIAFNKGKRLTTGRCVFSVFNQDSLQQMLNVTIDDTTVKVKDKFNKPSYFLNNPGEYNTGDIKLEKEIKATQVEVKYLDELPVVNLVIVGQADNIQRVVANNEKITDFKINATYKMTLKGVIFMNDTFGIAAGAPLQDQVVDFMAVDGVESWSEVTV